MDNQRKDFVGAFVYRPGIKPGTIDADWVQSDRRMDVVCKGIATGGPANGFVGDYTIVYQNKRGESSRPYSLRIDQSGEVFYLGWYWEGQKLYQGVGILRDGLLVGGWGHVG